MSGEGKVMVSGVGVLNEAVGLISKAGQGEVLTYLSCELCIYLAVLLLKNIC